MLSQIVNGCRDGMYGGRVRWAAGLALAGCKTRAA